MTFCVASSNIIEFMELAAFGYVPTPCQKCCLCLLLLFTAPQRGVREWDPEEKVACKGLKLTQQLLSGDSMVRSPLSLYVYIHIYIYIYICMCMYVYIYIYINVLTYTHVYIYIYIYICFADPAVEGGEPPSSARFCWGVQGCGV